MFKQLLYIVVLLALFFPFNNAFSATLAAYTDKEAPADEDVVVIADSEDNWETKNVAIGNIGVTDLTNTPGTDTVTIESSNGENTTLPAATTSTAGVLPASDKTKIDNLNTAAYRAVEDILTAGSNIPDGAAIKLYGDNNWDDELILITPGEIDAGTGTEMKGVNSTLLKYAAQTWGGITSYNDLTDKPAIPADISDNVLQLDNTTAFTPDADYEPATKKYVDDNAVAAEVTFTPTGTIEATTVQTAIAEVSADVAGFDIAAAGDGIEIDTTTTPGTATISADTESTPTTSSTKLINSNDLKTLFDTKANNSAFADNTAFATAYPGMTLGSGDAPTIQTADPTIASATGWYLATGSGDAFYVNSGVGIFTITGSYDSATHSLTFDLVDGNGTDKITYNSTDYTADPSAFTGLTTDQTFTCTADTGRECVVTGDNITESGGTYTADTSDYNVSPVITFSNTSISYFVEGFDGTGYENSGDWTEIIGSPDEDYATSPAPLSGTHSLYLGARENASDQEVYVGGISPTAGKTTVVKFMFHATDLPSSAGDTRLLTFETNTAERAYLRIENGDTTPTFTIESKGGTKVSTVTTLSEDTTYYVWVEWKIGTGSNALASVAFNTTDSRPTSGNNYAESTDGTTTIEINRIDLGGSNSYGTATLSYNVIIDDFEIWEED